MILPALECSPHKMRFMTKKIMKIVPVIKPEVRIVFAEKKKIQLTRSTRIQILHFHASPPKVL